MKLDYNKIRDLFTARMTKFFNDLADKNDAELIADMVCSICGDETDLYIKKDIPILKEGFCFNYKGFKCELSSCNYLTKVEQLINNDSHAGIWARFPNGIFTDRYVCWLWGKRDVNGQTLKDYLSEHSDETERDNNWIRMCYLVPGAWSWGASRDLYEGAAVDKIILAAIDKFIQEVGEDNL